MSYNKKQKKRKKSIATSINTNKQTKQPDSSTDKPNTADQQPQQPAPMVPTQDDEKWARFYETDANTALQNGYTKAHYESYLAKGGRSRLNVAPAPASAPAATSANKDEQSNPTPPLPPSTTNKRKTNAPNNNTNTTTSQQSLRKHLKLYFDRYDTKNRKSIDENQLYAWMLEVNTDQNKSPTLDVARQIIQLHDDNGDMLLQFKEFEAWFQDGAKLSKKKRAKISGKSETYRQSIAFVDHVTEACSTPPPATPPNITGLPRLNKTNLKLHFDRFDTNNKNDLNASQLLSWMLEVDRSKKNKPTIDVASSIIASHDHNGDMLLSYHELEMWMEGAIKLNVDMRAKVKKNNAILRQAVTFIEQLVQTCLNPPSTTPPTMVVEPSPSSSSSSSSLVKDDESTLPELNTTNLKLYFQRFDTNDKDGLNTKQLLAWMLEVNNDPYDLPTLADATSIIKSHDDNGDMLLQYEELEGWVMGGAKLIKKKRDKIKRKNVVFRRSLTFVECVAKTCTTPPPKGKSSLDGKINGLPPLNKVHLRQYFNKYDQNHDDGITDDELLMWMKEVMVDHGDPPTVVDAKNIIGLHDKNGDGILQYSELEPWIAGGAKLSLKTRHKIANKNMIYRHSIHFLEQVVECCTVAIEHHWEISIGLDAMKGFTNQGNNDRENTIVLFFNEKEVLRSTTISGKLNPNWDGKVMSCIVNVPINQRISKRAATFRSSVLKLAILGSDNKTMASISFTGEALETFATHKDDGSGIYTPKSKKLFLQGSPDKKASISAWVWIQKSQLHKVKQKIDKEIHEEKEIERKRREAIEKSKQKKQLLAAQKAGKAAKAKKAAKKGAKLVRVLARKPPNRIDENKATRAELRVEINQKKEERRRQQEEREINESRSGNKKKKSKRSNRSMSKKKPNTLELKEEITKRKEERRKNQEKRGKDNSLQAQAEARQNNTDKKTRKKNKPVGSMSSAEKKALHAQQKAHARQLTSRRAPTGKSYSERPRSVSPTPKSKSTKVSGIKQFNKSKASSSVPTLKDSKTKPKPNPPKKADLSYLHRLSANNAPTAKKTKPTSSSTSKTKKRKSRSLSPKRNVPTKPSIYNQHRIKKETMERRKKLRDSAKESMQPEPDPEKVVEKKPANKKKKVLKKRKKTEKLETTVPAKKNNLLPAVNINNLKRAFAQYDIDGTSSIDVHELFRWMLFMHGKNLTQNPNPPKLKSAKFIIGLHDNSGSGLLKYIDLEKWVITLGEGWNDADEIQRKKYIQSSENNRYSIQFVQQLVKWSVTVTKEVWLPVLHHGKLNSLFRQHASNDLLSAEQLLKWMVSLNKKTNDVPSLSSAKKIIAIDNNDTETMSYVQMKKWIDTGCNLPKNERDAFAATLESNRHAVRFLERLVIFCARDETLFYKALKCDQSQPGTIDSLPALNEENFFRSFSHYDVDGGLTIEARELFRWMLFMHGAKEDPPTLEDAVGTMEAIDASGDMILQYEEVLYWFQHSIALWNAASDDTRNELKKDATHRHSINFIKEVTVWSTTLTPDDWLPTLHRGNLKKEFLIHSRNKDYLTDAELFSWMKKMHRSIDDEPTMKDARKIISQHDSDGDKHMDYKELEKWVSTGAHLEKAEREQFASRSQTNRHAVQFLEDVCIHCADKIKLKRANSTKPLMENDSSTMLSKKISKASTQATHQKVSNREHMNALAANKKSTEPQVSISDQGAGAEGDTNPKKVYYHKKRMNDLAQPKARGLIPDDLMNKGNARVGDREIHSTISIQQELTRLEKWNKSKEKRNKEARQTKQNQAKKLEDEHCTFKPKLNKYNWKKKVGGVDVNGNNGNNDDGRHRYRSRSPSPPPTVTYGKRAHYSKYTRPPPNEPETFSFPKPQQPIRQHQKYKNKTIDDGTFGNPPPIPSRQFRRSNDVDPAIPPPPLPERQALHNNSYANRYSGGRSPSPPPARMPNRRRLREQQQQQRFSPEEAKRGRSRTRQPKQRRKKSPNSHSPSPGFDFNTPATSMSVPLNNNLTDQLEAAALEAYSAEYFGTPNQTRSSAGKQSNQSKQSIQPTTTQHTKEYTVKLRDSPSRAGVVTPPVRPSGVVDTNGEGLSPRVRRVRYAAAENKLAEEKNEKNETIIKRMEDALLLKERLDHSTEKKNEIIIKRMENALLSKERIELMEEKLEKMAEKMEEKMQEKVQEKMQAQKVEQHNASPTTMQLDTSSSQLARPEDTVTPKNDEEVGETKDEYYYDDEAGIAGTVTYKGNVVPKLKEEERFDNIMRQANLQALRVQQQRFQMEHDLLQADAEDIRLSTSINKANELIHHVSIKGTSPTGPQRRTHRYETTLANNITDTRPPHRRPHDGLATNRTRASILKQHPVYRHSKSHTSTNKRGNSNNKRALNNNNKKQIRKKDWNVYADLDPKAMTGRGTTGIPKLAKTGSFFMDHVENSNRRLERMVQQGQGRIELLQQLEFELLRTEFDSNFSSMEMQMNVIKKKERTRQNKMMVRDRKMREKLEVEYNRELLKVEKPPAKVLKHARAELELLKRNNVVSRKDRDEEKRKLNQTNEYRKKSQRLKKKKNSLRSTNVTEGGTLY